MKRQQFVNEHSYTFSDDALNLLREYSGGFLSGNEFEKLIYLYQQECGKHRFTQSSEANLLRLLGSLYGRSAFLKDSLTYPHYAEIIIAVSSNSNYLVDIIVRNPEYLYRILNTATLESEIDENAFADEAAKTAAGLRKFESKVKALRSLKRQEILRIGVQDILGLRTLPVITKELSVLASTLSALLFRLCVSEICTKLNCLPEELKYALFALGKLGGGELNYSSDIDLILFYEKPADQEKNLLHFDVLIRSIQLFIEQASAQTGTGFLYRVDFRLRPDGGTSPLCRTFNDTIHYYETRGEDWERQMLMKAGFIDGSKALFDKFFSYVRHFIYPESRSSSPLEQIKRLRSRVVDRLKNPNDIKQASGGIRDIEFSIQALQLLNGGTKPEVRTANTLEAIGKLWTAGLLSDYEASIFREAYIFYRKIEHYLQLMNDTQTHTIPDKGELLEKLAFFTMQSGEHSFLESVAERKREVGEIFDAIVNPDTDTGKSNGIPISLSPKAEKQYSYLSIGKGISDKKQFDKQTLEHFKRIEPDLLAFLGSVQNPEQVLINFARIIQYARFPSIWYEAFENKTLFQSFLTLCSSAQYCVDLFAENKQLRDDFLSGKAFTLREPVTKSLQQFFFAASVSKTLDIIDVETANREISAYIRSKTEQTAERYQQAKNIPFPFFIAAMGSLASGEMHFHSDADLLFIASETEDAPNAQDIFVSLLAELRKSTAPVVFDCRLRPEGKSSHLTWDIDGYEQYAAKRAAIWEFQALSKLRFLYGSSELFDRFRDIILNRVRSFSEEEVRQALLEMRKRVLPKQAPSLISKFHPAKNAGTVIDITYIIHYILLTNPELYLAHQGNHPLDQLNAFIDKRIIDEEDGTIMREHYLFFKNLELTNEILFNVSSSGFILKEEILERLAAAIGTPGGNLLKAELKRRTDEIAGLFSKYVEG